MSKATLARWLEKFEFSNNPFSSQEAGSEDPKRLNEYFVTPPCFDEILGDASLPETTLIFAPRGGGKTAQRVMVDYYCRNNLTGGRILSVCYTDFSQVMSHKEVHRDPYRVTAHHHAQEILKETISALASFFAQSPIAMKAFQKLPDRERTHLSWFISAYDDYLTLEQINTLSKNEALFGEFELNSIGFKQDSSDRARMVQVLDGKKTARPARLLDDLSWLLTHIGFEAIYILVDRVDEFKETAADLSAAVALVEPLAADLNIMELPRVAFKFFLPLEMEQAIRARPTIRLDRLRVLRIEWKNPDLLGVLHKRLEAFSSYSSLDAVCMPELRGRIEKEMLEVAKGSPRNLIRLGELLLSEHCEMPMPDKEEEWLISEEAWEAAKHTFAAERGGEWDIKHLETTVEEQQESRAHEVLLQAASDFPAPIALACRDLVNQIEPQRRFKQLLDLFEAAVTFSAFILICEYNALRSKGKGKTIRDSLGITLDRIYLGGVLNIIERLSGALASQRDSYYGRRFQRFYGRNRDRLDAFLDLRNEYAHGALQEDEDYTNIVERYIEDLITLLSNLRFMTQAMLVSVDSLKAVKNDLVHRVRVCMGDNPKFARKEISLSIPLECDKLWLITEKNTLSLYPLIVDRRCKECGMQTIFFYNSLEQENAVYLSYNCGHHFKTAQYVEDLKAVLGV